MYKTTPACTFTQLNCKYPYYQSYNTDKGFTNCPSLQNPFPDCKAENISVPSPLSMQVRIA